MMPFFNRCVRKRCQFPKAASKSDAFPGRKAWAAKKLMPESGVKNVKRQQKAMPNIKYSAKL